MQIQFLITQFDGIATKIIIAFPQGNNRRDAIIVIISLENRSNARVAN